jgi:hypothetical protein
MGLDGFPGWTPRYNKTLEQWMEENLAAIDQWESENMARAKYREEVQLVARAANNERNTIRHSTCQFSLSRNLGIVTKMLI